MWMLGNEVLEMKYTLFNKNIPAVDLEIDEWYGHVSKVTKIHNLEVLPLLAKFNHNIENGIREWLQDRSIPSSRIRDFGTKLSIQNLGLNLSDQYWFCPEGSGFSWKDVNLFQNHFDRKYVDREGNYLPEYSSNGQQDKYWEIRGERRVLVKESRKPFYQESCNEVFASAILGELGLDHIPYTKEGDNSICETGIDENTEYVPATHILNAVKKRNNDSNYTHLLRCMENLHIPAEKADIDNMIVFDYLIDNIDRNYGNFGFIRKAEGGEFIGFFPYFDHGNSMWYNEADERINALSLIQQTKPFYEDARRQLALAEDITAPFGDLTKDFLKEKVVEFYSESLTEARVSKLADAVSARLELIIRQRLNQTGNDINRLNTGQLDVVTDAKSEPEDSILTSGVQDVTRKAEEKIRKARLEASRKRREKAEHGRKPSTRK